MVFSPHDFLYRSMISRRYRQYNDTERVSVFYLFKSAKVRFCYRFRKLKKDHSLQHVYYIAVAIMARKVPFDLVKLKLQCILNGALLLGSYSYESYKDFWSPAIVLVIHYERTSFYLKFASTTKNHASCPKQENAWFPA